MKHIVLIILFFSSFSIYSQITTSKIEVKEKVKEQLIYDGKSNIISYENPEDYKQYIGQKIYTLKSFSPIYTSEGKRCDNYQNKYFTIKNITEKKVNSYSSDMVNENLFELINDENGETYYYNLKNDHKSIILVPYFLYLKKTYESKKYIIASYWREDGFNNEATNEWVKIDKKMYGGEWNCEVSILEKEGEEMICLIMKSNAGEIISTPIVDNIYFNKFSIVKELGNFVGAGLKFMSVDDYNLEIASKNKAKKEVVAKNKNKLEKLTQKYGKENAILISQNKVEIGMTKEMCKESWGIPTRTDVEKTAKTTKETFIYSWSKRLYFENNRLVKIEY